MLYFGFVQSSTKHKIITVPAEHWASRSSSELVPVHLAKQAAVTLSSLFVHLHNQDRMSCSVPS